MAKNKGKFGKGKSEVVIEDEFISGIERLTERLKPYAMRIVVALAAVLATAIGWAIYDWYQTGQAEDATFAYARALAVLDARVSPPAANDTGDQAGDDAPGDDASEEEGDEQSFDSEQDRRAAAIEALSKVRSDFGSSGIADHVRLVQASLLYAQGKTDEAGALYEAFAGDASGALAVIGREGHAMALESQALAAKDPAARERGLEEALAAFTAMQPKAGGALYARALYHQARILATLGRREEAAQRYREALEPAKGKPLELSIQLALDELGVPAPAADADAEGAAAETEGAAAETEGAAAETEGAAAKPAEKTSQDNGEAATGVKQEGAETNAAKPSPAQPSSAKDDGATAPAAP